MHVLLGAFSDILMLRVSAGHLSHHTDWKRHPIPLEYGAHSVYFLAGACPHSSRPAVHLHLPFGVMQGSLCHAFES